MDMHQVCEYPDSTISKVLTILKRWIIMTLNRKLMEKQRVYNHFGFHEVHIGHFFYNVNTISFGNRVTLSTFRFKHLFHVKTVVISNGQMWFVYSKQKLPTQHTQ